MSTQTGTDLDVVEHLDFEPPCSGPTCDQPARWVLRVIHTGEEATCGTFLACDTHKAHNQRRIDHATATGKRHVVCKPHKIRSDVAWEAL